MKKIILITGCSSGIGYDAAKALHAEGHTVFATCRKDSDVERLAAEGLRSIKLDLDSSDSIRAAVTFILAETHGELDVLINNGAYGQPGAVEDLSRAALSKQFETNVFGTHELTTVCLPALLRAPDARIINISSVLGLVAMRNRGAYIASKFALEGLSDTLRLELADTHVKVVLVEPGPITTQFRKNAFHAFLENIDFAQSRHQKVYEGAKKRFDTNEKQAFTLDSAAVTKKIQRAITSPKPKTRYYVTTATYLMSGLKWLLPSKVMDRILLSLSKSEFKTDDTPY